MNYDETQEPDERDEESGRSKSRRRDRKLMLEQEIKKLAEDEYEKARELLMIKKELNRLHYKVKNYHNQTRIVNAVIQVVIVILLLVITYKLYTFDLPVD